MIKIFHYDIYEYQLLQEELDKLAKKGYTTDKVSYITSFKKTDKPIYYLVDVFSSNETKGKETEELKRYVKYYLDNKYELISTFNNILVFKGNKELKPRHSKITISQKDKSIRLFQFLLSLFLLFVIYMFFINPLKPYHLLTNGNILFYLTLLFIPMAITYRTFLRWTGIYQLSKAINNKSIFEFKYSKHYYLASSIIPVVIIALMLFSYILDIFNTKPITDIPHNIPTLQSFNINNESQYSLYKRASIMVPESYEFVETSNDGDYSILVQLYKLHNNQSAQALLEDMTNNPDLLYVEEFKKLSNNEYLGYFNDKAYIKITIKDSTITLINTSFEIK